MKPAPINAPADAAHARFWRSLDELDRDASTASGVDGLAPSSRREFLRTVAASLAVAATAGCSRAPLEKIVPYHTGMSEPLYGKPVFYATALPRDGYAAGVLVECNMGRPTKIEGNPGHPASLGATDAITQAAVLDLWLPDRSQAVLRRGQIASWDALASAVGERLAALQRRRGEGLHVLTESVTSPTAAAQLAQLRDRLPGAQWHQWQPIDRDAVYEGARLAFGKSLEPIYRFDAARVIVALDGDFLGAMPGAVRYAHDFAANRSALANASLRNRLYAVEPTPTLTGAAADHRLGLRSGSIGQVAQALAHALGAHPSAPAAGVVPARWIESVVADLSANRGASIVVAGDGQPAAVHALAHAINARLGNIGRTVLLLPPVVADAAPQGPSLASLAQAMQHGAVDSLFVLGGNPVYSAPADLAFADALVKVPFSVHWGPSVDETGARTTWHVPAAHALEAWSDLRAFDGTATIVQPCIAPLYAGRSWHDVLALLTGTTTDAHALVQATWQSRAPSDFAQFWRQALQAGTVPGSAATPVDAGLRSDLPAAPVDTANELEIVFTPDPRMGDGRHADNPWLQELPHPLTCLTWDNAALVSVADAQRFGVRDEDVIEVRVGERSVKAPVLLMPGQADGVIAVALGHGRTQCSEIGRNRGFDAYALRTTADLWRAQGVHVRRTGARFALATTQTHARMEGRDIVRVLESEDALACAPPGCHRGPEPRAPTLYHTPPRGPYAWAMSIDLSSCIGCGACTIACQAENNIPTVGKEEVRRGREMHWIRVDRYYQGESANPRTVFQPVPCMQCEHAPCEVVCPVEASVHDAQGINVQVYNRCVGTRFCSNNCPYKVRRFNFFQYSKDDPALDAQRNPEVTVRMRGVMEKCNYCLQRITTAKIAADAAHRTLRDGEVVTACQAVCPTRAIVFGDLNDPASEVNARKRSPLDYTLLAELNTRPRTTYLARIVHSSAQLAPPRAAAREGSTRGP